MPTTSQLRLPPIQDEDLFEDFCRDLWATVWGDPDAERNGRRGQRQYGVDVYGISSAESKHEGVQAKAYGRPLTVTEIKREVNAAKKFSPSLSKLIIACTGPRDTKGQEYVREINIDHQVANLFSVTILGWEDIKSLVQEHWAGSRPDLIERYFEVTTTSGSLAAGIRETVENAVTKAFVDSVPAMSRLNALPDLVNQENYHAELNYARGLVNEAKPSQALDYLKQCRDRIWPAAKPPVRYRILHYQGCAECLLAHTTNAAKFLIEALQYNPEDETALAFAALGYLMLDDHENAAKYARRALRLNASNAKAYGTLLRSMDLNLPFEVLLAEVPEAYRQLPEVAIALASLARQKGMLVEAEQWCRVAVNQEQEKWCEPYGMLGEILMQQALTEGPLQPGMQISKEKREQLEEAEKAFTQAWDRVSQPDVKRTHISWLTNRSATRLLLDRPADAARDLDEVISLDDDPAVVLRRANIAVQDGEVAQAISLLERLSFTPDQVDLTLMLAELFTEVGRHSAAEQVLDRLSVESLPEVQVLSIHRIRLRIDIHNKKWAQAEERFAQMRASHSESIDVLVDGAWLMRLLGNTQASFEMLSEATGLLNVDSSQAKLIALAAEWYEIKEYTEAARLYERLADRDTNNPIARRLLLCLYNSAALEQALSLALYMLSLHGPLPTVSSIAVIILDEAGDLPQAQRIAEEYLTLYPADFDMQLRLASIFHRLGDTAGVDAFLGSPIPFITLPMDMALRVARLYAYRDRLKEALSIAYEVRRKNIGESEAHLFYVSLFFNTTKDDQASEPPEMSVSLDCAVCLVDTSGKEEWHIIDERDDHQMPLELAPNHPLARKLLGLPVGAVVSIKENDFSVETASVTVVQSKFAYAMQQSMNTYEYMFPETPGLWQMRLPMGEDRANGVEPDFDPFFQMITRKHERTLNIERLYREGKIPLAMLAQLLGQNIVQTWSTTVAHSGIGVRCCRGVIGEMALAQQLLKTATSFVIDPVSLLTLYGLAARDVLAQRFGRFIVPQSLIDMLQQVRQECFGLREGGSMTIGREGDHFVRAEITREHIQGNVSYLDGLLAWVGIHCTVTPLGSTLEKSRELRLRFKDMMDPCFVDSVLLASESGRIFYCDDERLRTLASSEMNVDGVWTQVLLAEALEESLTDEEGYSSDVIRLLSFSYEHIYMNPGIFLVAARKAEWHPVYPFSMVTRALAGNRADLTSAITVAAQAIYGIWMEALLHHQRSFLVTEILVGLSIARDRPTTINALVRALEKRFVLMPFQLQDVKGLIRTWADLHLM